MSDEKAYQVLARKYRPQTFADLIGQEAMVRTLKNAFAADRIAHAFVMTGVPVVVTHVRSPSTIVACTVYDTSSSIATWL